MSDADIIDVLDRAVEAGYFDEAIREYLATPQRSAEEARAYQALFYAAWDLVGIGRRLPEFRAVITDGHWRGTAIAVGSKRFRDHLTHSEFAGLVDERYLVDNAIAV